MTKLEDIYHQLFAAYGAQGWWPLLDHNGSNPTAAGVLQGYHPGDYSFPKNRHQRFEICCGAILVQHAFWTSAEKALVNMQQKGLIDPASVLKTRLSTLAKAIKPAGFPKQKAQALITFAGFFDGLGRRIPKREDLMDLKGIGNETADTMLCFAWGQRYFIVDAYKKRVLGDLGLIDPDSSYKEIRKVFTDNLPDDIQVYQEYHALVVEHAKRLKTGGAVQLTV